MAPHFLQLTIWSDFPMTDRNMTSGAVSGGPGLSRIYLIYLFTVGHSLLGKRDKCVVSRSSQVKVMLFSWRLEFLGEW